MSADWIPFLIIAGLAVFDLLLLLVSRRLELRVDRLQARIDALQTEHTLCAVCMEQEGDL